MVICCDVRLGDTLVMETDIVTMEELNRFICTASMKYIIDSRYSSPEREMPPDVPDVAAVESDVAAVVPDVEPMTELS